MKTSSIRPDHAIAKVAGRVAGNRAGSPGIRVYDVSSGDIAPAPEIQFVGAQVSGEDGAVAIVTITGTGQQVTNAAAVALTYGDVVVLTTTGTVTTTTTAQDTRPVGVVQIGGNVGDPVSVVFSGYVAKVNTTGTVAAGDFLETSTTAGKASSGGVTRRIGSFALALAAGPNPPALLFGIPDSSGTGTGSAQSPVEHGNMGTTETIDLAVGSVHRGTLNANCTITVTGFSVDRFADPLFFEVAQNGTGGYAITWDPDVVWYGNTQPTLTATAVTQFVFFGMNGDPLIYAFQVGGSGSALTVKDEGVALATAATSLDFVGSGVVASGTGAAKTITIAGGATATDTNIWRPVLDGAGAVIADGVGQALMAFGPA